MEALTVVKEMKELAQNPKHRQTIISDKASMDSLVVFLDHSDPMVVEETLLVFMHLTSSLENRQSMRTLIDLVQQLKTLHENKGRDCEIRKLAGEVYRRLDLAGGIDFSQSGVIRKGNSRIATAPVTKSPFIKKSKKARSLVFFIEGLDKEARPLIENVFFSVVGLISFTFDMAKQRTVVRVRPEVAAASVAQAVAKAGLPCPQQVVKNAKGEEEYITFESSRPASPLPDYLPEQDPEVEDPTTAIRPQGDNSQGEDTWLSATINYLARSMYW